MNRVAVTCIVWLGLLYRWITKLSYSALLKGCNEVIGAVQTPKLSHVKARSGERSKHEPWRAIGGNCLEESKLWREDSRPATQKPAIS
jgi:hypothetical protein